MAGYVLLGARSLLATVFTIAFLGKARNATRFERFTTSVSKLAMLPPAVAHGVAAAVVTAEGATAVLLATPTAPRAGFALAACLLGLFTGVVVRAVRAGVLAECRCFGKAGSVMGYSMVARNTMLLGCAIPGALAGPVAGGVRPGFAAFAVAAGCVLALLFSRYYDDGVRRLLRAMASESHRHAGTRETGR